MPLASGLCPVDGCARWQQWFGLLYPVLLVAAAALARGRVPPGRRRPDRAARVAAPVAQLAPGRRRRADPARVRPQPARRDRPAGQRPLPVGAADLAAGGALAALAGGGRLAGGAPPAGGRRLAGARWPPRCWPRWPRTALAATVLLRRHAGIAARGPRSGRPGNWPTRCARAGLREVYGDYWTCNRLIFNTGETVVCGVLDGDLTPGAEPLPAVLAAGGAGRPARVRAGGRLPGGAAAAPAARRPGRRRRWSPRWAAIACTTPTPCRPAVALSPAPYAVPGAHPAAALGGEGRRRHRPAAGPVPALPARADPGPGGGADRAGGALRRAGRGGGAGPRSGSARASAASCAATPGCGRRPPRRPGGSTPGCSTRRSDLATLPPGGAAGGPPVGADQLRAVGRGTAHRPDPAVPLPDRGAAARGRGAVGVLAAGAGAGAGGGGRRRPGAGPALRRVRGDLDAARRRWPNGR